MAIFRGMDQFRHKAPNGRSVFVLIAARTDGKVKPFKIGAIIYGNPVIADVIEVGDSLGVVWNSEPGTGPR
jgi:hypothetical protein